MGAPERSSHHRPLSFAHKLRIAAPYYPPPPPPSGGQDWKRKEGAQCTMAERDMAHKGKQDGPSTAWYVQIRVCATEGDESYSGTLIEIRVYISPH